MKRAVDKKIHAKFVERHVIPRCLTTRLTRADHNFAAFCVELRGENVRYVRFIAEALIERSRTAFADEDERDLVSGEDLVSNTRKNARSAREWGAGKVSYCDACH